jgi:hypothetical protein
MGGETMDCIRIRPQVPSKKTADVDTDSAEADQ